MTTKIARSKAFLAKAAKMTRWCSVTFDEMLEHGKHARMDDVERVFFALLAQITSIHEALASGAGLLGQAEWREELNHLRKTDPLLLYIWKARDSDIHDALLKWRPGAHAMEFRVMDQAKAAPIAKQFYIHSSPEDQADRLIMFACGVHTRDQLMDYLDKGGRPLPELVDRAGIEMRGFLESLSLEPFSTRIKGHGERIDAPRLHLNEPIPPTSVSAIAAATAFYALKCEELKELLIASERALTPQADPP